MATEFNPDMINAFKKGIEERDPDLVQASLNSGVRADTLVQGWHPAIFLLSPSTAPRQKPTEEVRKSTSRILGKLLEGGMQMTEPEKYVTQHHDYVVDRLLLSDQIDDVSNLVIHAIYETLSEGRPVYKPDIGKIVDGNLRLVEKPDGTTDYKAQVSYALTRLEAVHETVRQRLLAPKTMVERELAANFAGSIGYWTEAFDRPPLRLAFADLGIPVNGAAPALAQKKRDDRSPAQMQEDKFKDEMAQYVTQLEKKPPQTVLAEMQGEFIGLDGIKRSARKMMLREQFDASRAVMDLPETQKSYSTVLLGNPGTGKTTVARKQAELLHALGISGPNYVEVSRENLVAGYVGQTEQKMLALFMQADVVFIDEAYNLSDGSESGADYGKNVVGALLLALENRRDNLTIFFAGYPEEMEKFLTSNPGLKSRIGFYQTLEDPTLDQLGQVLDLRLAKGGFTIEPEARARVLKELEETKKKLGAKYFGNAREVRKIVDQIPDAIAERIFGDETKLAVPDKASLTQVTLQDIESLNLKEILGGRALEKPAGGYGGTKIGFTAKI